MNSPERDPTALAPSKFVIEDLRPGDTDGIEQAAALLVGAFPRWTATLDAARDEVAELPEPGHICLAVRIGNAVVGWIGAIPSYSHALELHPLVVRDDVRGRGIGRTLVAALEEQVRLRGVLTLYLGTDDDGPVPGTSAGGVDLFPGVASHAANLVVVDHAAGFYRRLGFEVVGLIPDANGPGKPEVLLAKRIGSGQ
jgi:aminoglycoside 6'-N-acetyltransferase I